MNELHTRGVALLRAGREHEATSCLREAVSLEPEDARAHYHLALAYRLRGELTEARNELLAALELEPTLAPACAQLGSLALVAGELQEAVSWLSRALAIHPGHRISRYQLGVALRFAGHRAEALSLLQASLEPGPDALPPVLAHRVRGQLVDALNDPLPGARPLVQCAAPLVTELLEERESPREETPHPESSEERVTQVMTPLEAARLLADARSILALTGSGISVGSGLATRKELWLRWDRDAAVSVFKFREAPNVLWEVIADFLGERRHRPDAAHLALATCPDLIGIVTQNVDGLHQGAHREVYGESVPMPPVVELHGTLLETRCHDCDARPGRTAGSYVEAAAPRPPRCERCDGPLRPDVVLFGERVAPERMSQALELVRRCDALLVVGTAMDVAPASELPRIARANGVPVVEIKRTASRLSRSLDTVLVPGESDTVLPELMESLRRMRCGTGKITCRQCQGTGFIGG